MSSPCADRVLGDVQAILSTQTRIGNRRACSIVYPFEASWEDDWKLRAGTSFMQIRPDSDYLYFFPQDTTRTVKPKIALHWASEPTGDPSATYSDAEYLDFRDCFFYFKFLPNLSDTLNDSFSFIEIINDISSPASSFCRMELYKAGAGLEFSFYIWGGSSLEEVHNVPWDQNHDLWIGLRSQPLSGGGQVVSWETAGPCGTWAVQLENDVGDVDVSACYLSLYSELAQAVQPGESWGYWGTMREQPRVADLLTLTAIEPLGLIPGDLVRTLRTQTEVL